MKILALYAYEGADTPTILLSDQYVRSDRYLVYPSLPSLAFTEGTLQADIEGTLSADLWGDSTYAELVELDLATQWEQRQVLAVYVVRYSARDASGLEIQIKAVPHVPDYGSIFGTKDSIEVDDEERSYLQYSTDYPPTWLGDNVSGFPYYYPVLWRTAEALVKPEGADYYYQEPTYYLPYERLQALQQPKYALYNEENRRVTTPTTNQVLDTSVWDSADIPYATLELDPTPLAVSAKLITDESPSPDTVVLRLWPLTSSSSLLDLTTGDYVSFLRSSDMTTYKRKFGALAGGSGYAFNLVNEEGDVAAAGAVSPTLTEYTISNVTVIPHIPNQKDAVFLFDPVSEYGLISPILVRGVTSLQINTFARTINWFLRNQNITIDAGELAVVSGLLARKGRYLPHYLFREQVTVQSLLEEIESFLPVYFFYDKWRGLYPVYYGSATDMEVVGELDIRDEVTTILLATQKTDPSVKELTVDYGYCPKQGRNRYTGQSYVDPEADKDLAVSIRSYPHVGDRLMVDFVANEQLFRLSRVHYRIQVRCYDPQHQKYGLSEVLSVLGTEYPDGLYRIIGKASYQTYTDYDLVSA